MDLNIFTQWDIFSSSTSITVSSLPSKHPFFELPRTSISCLAQIIPAVTATFFLVYGHSPDSAFVQKLITEHALLLCGLVAKNPRASPTPD